MAPLLRRQVSRSVTLFVCWISRCRIEASLFNSLHHSAAVDFRLATACLGLFAFYLLRCCHLDPFFPGRSIQLAAGRQLWTPGPQRLVQLAKRRPTAADSFSCCQQLYGSTGSSVDCGYRQGSSYSASRQDTQPEQTRAAARIPCDNPLTVPLHLGGIHHPALRH